MSSIVAINFKKGGKGYFFDSDDISVKEGDFVVVNTEKGDQLGKVLMCNIDLINNDSDNEIKKIIRLASKNDIDKFYDNIADAKNMFSIAKDLSKELGLGMNIIDVFYTLDKSTLNITYSAESRVDFREYVRELASIARTRIDMRQVGVRDKAKEISGIGQCGRELCCSSYLSHFPETVSIQMAKNQGLSLNPVKINGQCGRLLCCLTYEDSTYTCYKKDMPVVGDYVTTDKGNGNVVAVDVYNRNYTFVNDDGERIVIYLSKDCDGCYESDK